MRYGKVNVLGDLQKMAKGQRTKAPAWLVAELAASRLAAKLVSSDVLELERLFHLPDTRA